MFTEDPGPCLICGTAHCSCGSDTGSTVQQLPARDAAAAAEAAPPPAQAPTPDPAPAPIVTTGTYRRQKARTK